MIRNLSRLILAIILLSFTIEGCIPHAKMKPLQVEIKNGWYYLNGERFFIKAIGYEIGARPGQDPYKDTIADLSRMRADMQVLKAGGFNAIRTWSQLSEEQLKIVQESGLKIIFGIWLKPEGNYGDSIYQKTSEDLVRSVVSYSKNYDCIISYLILNEPMTGHIHDVGARGMVSMLERMKNILHAEHPGIPVGISGNAATDDFLDMNLLDFYGYNCYDYSNGQVGTMGYKGFLSWCDQLNQRQKPMIITEFGYSVSDNGWNQYGGNTLEEQKEGVLRCYRGLLDAGAAGACPFYYADGWWKGGEPAVHNNTPEEWFGYWGYSDLHDSVGSPRPVWYALVNYQKALILSPKNQEIYDNRIPLDVFLDGDIGRVTVKLHDSVLYTRPVSHEGFLTDTIAYIPKGIEDAELAFEFADHSGRIIKTEQIYTLLSLTPVDLPKFQIAVNPSEDLDLAKKCSMNVILENMGKFTVVSDLQYNFNYHIGWESGVEGKIPVKMESGKNVFGAVLSSEIPDNAWVLTASAGVTVKYGKFFMRLHDQKMIYRGKWYEGIGR